MNIKVQRSFSILQYSNHRLILMELKNDSFWIEESWIDANN